MRSCSCRVHRAERSITLGRRSFGRGVFFRALTFMYKFSGEIAVMWPRLSAEVEAEQHPEF